MIKPYLRYAAAIALMPFIFILFLGAGIMALFDMNRKCKYFNKCDYVNKQSYTCTHEFEACSFCGVYRERSLK